MLGPVEKVQRFGHVADVDTQADPVGLLMEGGQGGLGGPGQPRARQKVDCLGQADLLTASQHFGAG